MDMKNTNLSFLADDCKAIFGDNAGTRLYQTTEEIYNSLMSKADDRGNAAIRLHFTKNLYPTMAYYLALRKANYSEQDALSYVRRETHKAAESGKEQNKKLAAMPFTYQLYKLMIKNVMKKNYPVEGWDTEWVRCDSHEVHLNIKRCIYDELTRQHGCPELCCVYCENDDITFAGLMPKIRFERAGTIGKGADHCDFHYIRNK